MLHWVDSKTAELRETPALSGYVEREPARIPADVAIELLEERIRQIRERMDDLADEHPQLRKT
jgi:hypothetical protein